MNQDMSQYLGVFLDEATEQLALLERECVELERSDNAAELLQDLFRAAHTIKGASRAMGFLQIGDLTHEMENVLDELRNTRLALSKQVIDALLTGIDALSLMLESVRNLGCEPDVESSEVVRSVAQLKLAMGCAQQDVAAPPVESVQATEQDPTNEDAVAIVVELKPDCAMKGCRALLIVQSVSEWADVVGTVPDSSILEAEQFGSSFKLLVTRETAANHVPDKIRELSDVQQASYVQEPAPEADQPREIEKSVAKASAAHGATQTVRVDVTRLDKLLNLVGELVIDRTQLQTQLSAARATGALGSGAGSLDEVLGRIERVTSELQEEVMKSRMLPIDGVFQRMPRMVRDVAQKLGKDISFEMSGGDTELDRSVLDVIGDPLIHILRNAVDHGVEDPETRVKAGKSPTGTVKLTACRDRNQILIEVSDDGKGIDPDHLRRVAVKKGILSQAAADATSDRDALSLIFAAGLSTAKVVSDVSGRGVGMDIVKSNLEKVGGRATVESTPGSGSKITINLPLTLAIVKAVLVKSANCTYAVPVSAVMEMIDLNRANGAVRACTLAGQAAILLRGQTLPLVNLNDALESDVRAVDPTRNAEKAHAVIVRHENGHAALSVDALLGDQEIVIKPIGGFLGEIPGVAGASILGDGRVALIVDPSRILEGLFQRSKVAA